MSASKVIRETEHFTLEVGPLERIEQFRGQVGYILRNKRTLVIEREGVSEAEAIRVLYMEERAIADVLAAPEGTQVLDSPEPGMVN